MIYALIEYINRNGNISIKSVSNRDELSKLEARLEERVRKGTCGGYMITLV